MISSLADEPSNWPKASMRTLFPDPDSPVMTLNPGRKVIRWDSTRAKFLIPSWLRCVVFTTEDGAADSVVDDISLVIREEAVMWLLALAAANPREKEEEGNNLFKDCPCKPSKRAKAGLFLILVYPRG